MTRRERLERKLEKRQEWADKRRADAQQRFDYARKSIEHIPFGQPILVGHHSEKRHRADLARHDNNMRKGCEAESMAAHHESKAAGLESQLERSVFSDDPDAIEQLEAKIAAAEKEQELHKAINKIVKSKPKNEETPAKLAALIELGISERLAKQMFIKDFAGRYGIPAYELSNNNANIRRMRLRIADIKRRQERQALAEASPNGVTIRTGGEGIYCWAQVTFAEKPDREILAAIKEAGFYWGSGSWSGPASKLPDCVKELA